MTLSVLFIQGAGPGAHAADRVLADELQHALGDGFRVHFPRLPHEQDPDMPIWRRVILHEATRCVADVIVAHSAGAAVLADWLAEGRCRSDLTRVHAIALLAPPYVGDGGWDLGGFHLDAHRASPPELDVSLYFYFGGADTVVPADHASLYRQVFPRAAFVRLADGGHQFEGQVATVAHDLHAALDRQQGRRDATPGQG